MKAPISFKRLLVMLCMVLFYIISLSPATLAVESQISDNRFNVVFVVDASGSMNYTDKGNLRFEAIELFTNLLAEKGNTLGGIAFSKSIDVEQPLLGVSSQADRDTVTSALRSVTPDGYTNIGVALSGAVNMLLANGNQELPSVIVFLSDGNTEMASEKEQMESLEMKADALYAARQNDIQIYTVCLNANGKADISEMEQISSATGGVFEEVSSADDLQDVFNTFYNLIYGTSTIALADDMFASDGTLATPFQVPGIGVEEVNIIITGTPGDITLVSPDGSAPNVSSVSSESCTFLKMTNVIPGGWILNTVGVPGDHVKINMVYNLNLEVVTEVSPDKFPISSDQSITFTAMLNAGAVSAKSAEQYIGYAAEVEMMDAYHEPVKTVPMQVIGNRFEAVATLPEGTYFCAVRVSGNHIEKMSNEIGPISVVIPQEVEAAPANIPPVPVENPVKRTVYILPFRSASLSVDLTSLAADADGDPLQYKIISSSFMEGKDYEVAGDTLTMDNFSLFKGSYDIRATDPLGESCSIDLVVTSVNVGIVALILLGLAALVTVVVFVILLYIALTKPFRGTISVQSYCNGSYKKGTPPTLMRGRCKLSVFRLDPIGLDYTKSYFQATGQPYIYLVTNIPVIWNTQKTSKIKILSGAAVNVYVDENRSKSLTIRFDSRMTNKQVIKPKPRAPRVKARR